MATFLNETKTAISPFNTSKGYSSQATYGVGIYGMAIYGIGVASVGIITNLIKNVITPSNQIKN